MDIFFIVKNLKKNNLTYHNLKNSRGLLPSEEVREIFCTIDDGQMDVIIFTSENTLSFYFFICREILDFLKLFIF